MEDLPSPIAFVGGYLETQLPRGMPWQGESVPPLSGGFLKFMLLRPQGSSSGRRLTMHWFIKRFMRGMTIGWKTTKTRRDMFQPHKIKYYIYTYITRLPMVKTGGRRDYGYQRPFMSETPFRCPCEANIFAFLAPISLSPGDRCKFGMSTKWRS